MRKWLIWTAAILFFLAAEGSVNQAAAAQTATAYVSPPSGKIGSPVSVSGSGFPVNSSIGIQFLGKGRAVGTDQYGQFTTIFVVPPMEAGRYDVEVSGGGARILSSFEVLPPTLTISLSSYQVKAGDKISLRIDGAAPFNPFQVYLGDGTIITVPVSPLIGSDGTSTVEAIIPPFSPGNYYLKVFKGTKSEAGQLITILPEPPGKIERVLSPVSKCVERVWGYQGGVWKMYDPAVPPELNTLTEFKAGEGYFIRANEACQLFSRTWHWNLYKGWNLIGWID